MDQKDYSTRLKIIATNEYYTWKFLSTIIGLSTSTLKKFVSGEYVSDRSKSIIKDYVDHYENAKY